MTNVDTSAKKYLQRTFALNPVWRAEDIVSLRSRSLRIPRKDAISRKEETGVDVARLREAAKRQIGEIQSQFWKLPIDQLKRHLENMDVKKLPELAPVVKRLRTAAACRGEFPRLLQEPWMGRKLFEAFKAAAVLPPSEAGFVRERFMARITSKGQLKKIKAAVSKIESNYPVLYALERDWFTTLKKHKFVSSGSVYEEEYGGGGWSLDLSGFGWPAWLVVFMVIRVILRLMSSSHE